MHRWMVVQMEVSSSLLGHAPLCTTEPPEVVQKGGSWEPAQMWMCARRTSQTWAVEALDWGLPALAGHASRWWHVTWVAAHFGLPSHPRSSYLGTPSQLFKLPGWVKCFAAVCCLHLLLCLCVCVFVFVCGVCFPLALAVHCLGWNAGGLEWQPYTLWHYVLQINLDASLYQATWQGGAATDVCHVILQVVCTAGLEASESVMLHHLHFWACTICSCATYFLLWLTCPANFISAVIYLKAHPHDVLPN